MQQDSPGAALLAQEGGGPPGFEGRELVGPGAQQQQSSY